MRVTDDPLSQRESRIKLLSFAIYTLPRSDFHICHRLVSQNIFVVAFLKINETKNKKMDSLLKDFMFLTIVVKT